MNSLGLSVRLWALLVAAAVCAPIGCTRPPAAPLRAPYPTLRSLVVLPLSNQSPSGDVDGVVAADILAAELAQVDGLVVLPTNRALKLLLVRGKTHATSLAEALDVAGELGADGVVMGAVTEYKPYKPQKLGMILQLHWLRADRPMDATDPVSYSRRPRGSDEGFYGGRPPASQAQALFDGRRNDVTGQIHRYARDREGMDSPLGWRRYLTDSDAFMHFVCHEMIIRLLDAELQRITTPVGVAQLR